MQAIEKALGGAIGGATLVSAVALVLMMVHITADVAAKFFLSSPLPGTIAIVSNYYMVAVVFLPLAFAERGSKHISVEILVERLALPVQRRLNAGASLYAAVIFGLLTWRGVEEALRKTQVSTFIIEQDVRIDTWPAFYLMPIGTGLIVAALVYKLARYGIRGAEFDVDRAF